jgi:hypothetical protein
VSDAAAEEIVEVRLLGLPLDVHRRTTEHQDEVTREFQLIAIDPSTAPARLIALGEELQERYAGFTAEPSAELERALAGAGSTVDLVYRVPASAVDAVLELNDVLDEVDAYCEAGGMLALAASEEARSYRRWFLAQFLDQIGGADPVPWSEWEDRPLRPPARA